MTTEEHNKTIGILHLVYGGLHTALILFISLFLIPLFMMPGPPGRSGDPEGAAFAAIILGIFGFFWLALSVPSFVAGYGMLKQKSWAKVWAMIAGGLAGMSFPLGTGLCVYTFWFLFSGGGNKLYDHGKRDWNTGRPGVLHGAPDPANWSTKNREREYTFSPRSGPPDWRGE